MTLRPTQGGLDYVQMTYITDSDASAVPSAEEKPPSRGSQAPADTSLRLGQPQCATRKRLSKIPGLAPGTFSAMVELVPGALEQADGFLNDSLASESASRLSRVEALIEGFETPYGMELLSSLHWLAHHATPRVEDHLDATNKLKSWNARKNNLFQEHHVKVAWDRLVEMGWITRGGNSGGLVHMEAGGQDSWID